jgi:hypothetical protein
MNVIKKQRDGIYNDLMQAATALLPLKAQEGQEAYREQAIKAMTNYTTALKSGKEYQTFCQLWGLDQDEFIDEILSKAILSIE